MNINFRQLVFAREFRGLSQTELASKIEGLSQPNLSKYEKGFNSLSEDMVFKIIHELGFPKSWLHYNVSNCSENANYRIKTTITQRDKTSIDFGNRLIGFIVDQLSDSLDWPEFKHVPLDIEHGYTPSEIAKHARKILGLMPGDPVSDIFTLLENKGIVIVEIKAHEKFDGVSFITDKGTPVIIINRDFSNDRKRRTVAHEYGHILMHCYFPIPQHRNTKLKEEEVEEFTSEFLMPADFIRNSLIGLRIGNLAELKRFWLTSMASIVRRAKDLRCISDKQYTYFNIELSRNGKRIDEGVYVPIDEPILFTEAYRIHKEDLGYSDIEISEAFSLPVDVIWKFCRPNGLRVIHNHKST